MVNPWLEWPAKAPFVLPQDQAEVKMFAFLCDAKGADFAHKYGLQTQLYPEPFLGNPNAPVVLFQLNPGYTGEEEAARRNERNEDWWHQNDAAMQACSIKNLRHEPMEYPLFFLDPHLRSSPGGRYYRLRLRSLIDEFGYARTAQNVLVVEYFPYHSRQFSAFAKVESQGYALDLVRKAMARSACIIIMRAKRVLREALPELANYPFLSPNSAQSGYVSPGNIARFNEIRNAILGTEQSAPPEMK